ncbi:ribosome modulation factor [Agaribacterium haliotis]|uniref:ribosome modulation factor n=1 Tax=Agaribacterium haliotis TaxID=2013869 RepID=UPI000BB54E5B|nr:ribosome modulation factor [Agaribacterium haliotis]
MKRQKRDRSELAMSRGYQVGFSGSSREKCPYEQGSIRYQWLSGWRQGREDRWDGYNRAACAQKLSNMHGAYF